MRARLLIITLVCLASTGCFDYGDQALNFVDKDANRMARALAEADLKGRWLNAAMVVQLELGLRVQLWDDAVATLPAPADLVNIPKSDGALKEALAALDSEMSLLLRLKADAERLQSIRASWQKVCDSREAFDAFELGRLGWAAPIKSLTGQTHDQGVGLIIAGWDLWSTLIVSAVLTATENIMRGLKSQAIKEQNAKLRTAQERFFTVVPQPDELFAISRGICAEYQTVIQKAILGTAALEGPRAELVQQRVLHALNARTVMERRWIAAVKASNRLDAGAAELVRSQAALDAERVLNDLIFLRRRAEALSGIARLSAAELLLDGAVEAQAQLQADGIKDLVSSSLLDSLVSRAAEEKRWAQEQLARPPK